MSFVTGMTPEAPAPILLPAVQPTGSLVVYQPNAFDRLMDYGVAGEGQNLAQIVAELKLPAHYERFVHVWVDDVEVPREFWSRVRPRAGRTVFVRIIPQGGGGGGDKVLRTILLIAVVVVAVALGQIYGVALAGAITGSTVAAGSAAALAATAAITVSVTMLGQMALNALIPPPTPTLDVNLGGDQSPIAQPRYQLTGTQNRYAPYANIPRVMGKKRIYPLLASFPYTELQGNDEYMRMALCVGWGPLRISDIRIGETPITAFEGVEVEVREGWSTDAPLTLFTRSIEQQNLSVVLDPNEWSQRRSEPDTSELIVDISFPTGLAYYNDQGGRDPLTVDFLVQYAVAGSNNWQPASWANALDAGFGTAGVITVTSNESSAFTRSGRWTVPKGQYDVRIQRTTALRGDRYIERAGWSVFRFVTDSAPILQKGVALIAVRIKATGQLNGVPNAINCVAESYLPVYNGATWNYQITRNPAWAFTDILRRRGNETYLPDSRLDLSVLQAWAAACDATAPNANEPYWTFDGVIEGGSVFQNLRLIASHARANFNMRDGKYSVVRDVAQSVPVQHITPRNSWGYSGTKTFVDYPHALRVKFVNAEAGGQEDERIVYDDGYGVVNATRFETVDLPGCASPTQAYREGRYLLAVGKLRPEQHIVTMDIENLRCSLGDLVLFSHDVVAIGVASSRITARTINASNQVTALTLEDEVLFEEGVTKSYVLRVRRSTGASELYSLVSAQGYQGTLVLQTPVAMASAPAIGDLVMFGEASRETAPMLVRKIEPGSNFTARVTLVDAQPGVWTADTGPIPAFNSYITIQTPPSEAKPQVPGVGSVRSDETVILRQADGTLLDRIFIELLPPLASVVRTASFEVQWREQGAANWLSGPRVSVEAPAVSLSPVVAKLAYEIRVRGISEASVAGDWSPLIVHTVVGKTTPPRAPEAFSAEGRVDGVQLSWLPSLDIDVIGYTIKLGADWAEATIISEKVAGTSLFVGLTTAENQTFLIKAVDSVGLESLTALSVNTSVVAPPAVENFQVYAQEDRVQAAWSRIDSAAIEYEIREGTSWSTGNVIGRTAGNTLTVMYPVRQDGDVTYWIKAVSAAGVYSSSASFATTRQAPVINRNILLERDFGALNWPGVLHDFEPVSTTLQLARINGVNSPRAEYYAPISLAQEYYARSWIELRSSAIGNDGLTWGQAPFAWSDNTALTWIGDLLDSDAAVTRAYISPKTDLLDAGVTEGWTLANTTTGVLGTAAALSQGVSYQPCRFQNGAKLSSSGRLEWNASVPSIFSVVFDYRPSDAMPNSIRNPNATGAVAGTPGTAPTFWGPVGQSSLQTAIVGSGTEDGHPYVDVRWYGTTTANARLWLRFDTSFTTLAVSPGYTARMAVNARVVGGAYPGTDESRFYFVVRNSALTLLTDGVVVVPAPTSAPLRDQRLNATRLINEAGAAWVQPEWRSGLIGTGAAVDVTIRFSLPFLGLAFVNEDHAITTLRSGDGWLRLAYEAASGLFYLADHLGERIDLAVPNENDDVITFGIAQAATSRSLFAVTRRHPTPYSAQALLGPVGTFNALALTA
jgi:hypothetical protein